MAGMYPGERFNAWSHLVGAVFALTGATWLIITASLPHPHSFTLQPLAHAGLWIAIAYQAALATALAFFLMVMLQVHLGATEVAIIYAAEPAFSALLAMSGWVPGIRERLLPLQYLGGLIILAAMIFIELVPTLLRKKPAATEAPSP